MAGTGRRHCVVSYGIQMSCIDPIRCCKYTHIWTALSDPGAGMETLVVSATTDEGLTAARDLGEGVMGVAGARPRGAAGLYRVVSVAVGETSTSRPAWALAEGVMGLALWAVALLRTLSLVDVVAVAGDVWAVWVLLALTPQGRSSPTLARDEPTTAEGEACSARSRMMYCSRGLSMLIKTKISRAQEMMVWQTTLADP